MNSWEIVSVLCLTSRLNMLQTAEFAALAAMIGPVFSAYAIENNKITQAESAW